MTDKNKDIRDLIRHLFLRPAFQTAKRQIKTVKCPFLSVAECRGCFCRKQTYRQKQPKCVFCRYPVFILFQPSFQIARQYPKWCLALPKQIHFRVLEPLITRQRKRPGIWSPGRSGGRVIMYSCFWLFVIRFRLKHRLRFWRCGCSWKGLLLRGCRWLRLRK